MSPAPPPRASPEPPYPDESDSGLRQLSAREVRQLREAETKALKAAADKATNSKALQAFAASIVAAVGIAFGVFFKLEARGQERQDAGLVAPTRRIEALEDDSKEVKARLAAVERTSIRTEAMVEMLLENRNLTPPPKQPSPDGGP